VSAPARNTRSVLLSLAVFGLACTDAPTASRDGEAEERVVVSVAGVAGDDAGIVLRLTGAVHSVDAARQSLDLAWSMEAGASTVAVVGALAESGALLVVRRRVTSEPLWAEVMQVAGEDGELLEVARVRVETRRLEE
jgi:hypothetical protein